jgi:hypothetical protein
VAHQISITESAAKVIDKVKDPRRVKKIAKCLGLLEQDHRHPSLASHRYESFDSMYGERIWESYVEQNTPSAWRVWWFFGPEDGEITVVDIGPHP